MHFVNTSACVIFLARSISEDFSSGDASRYRDEEYSQPHTGGGRDREKQNREREERDEGSNYKQLSFLLSSSHAKFLFAEVVKVFDGNCSLRRRIFRTIVVPRQAPLKQVLVLALRTYHITKDPNTFYLTDLYSTDEAQLQDPTPVINLHHKEGKRPAVFLRFK